MLKPDASFSFPTGSLSGAAASGGGATGANFAAASLSGRPIIGDPGGSAGAAPAAGGLVCCADAATVKALTKTPASRTLRGDRQIVISSSLSGGPCAPQTVRR